MSDPAGMFAPRKRASSRVGRNAPKGKKTVGSEVCISVKHVISKFRDTNLEFHMYLLFLERKRLLGASSHYISYFFDWNF